MEFTLATDVLGRLSCAMSDGQTAATVSASNRRAASSDLMEAIEGAASTGYGECYWQQAEGEYRWMFRREGARVRVAVLWSTGTLTGWEHVFWSECDFEPFARHVRDEVARQN
jgi:hypothetical protein